MLFVSDETGAVDLEFAPDNPDEIYATTWRAERKPWTIISGGEEGGVYKSMDAGENWKELTNGLPRGPRGKAESRGQRRRSTASLCSHRSSGHRGRRLSLRRSRRELVSSH